MKVLDKVGFRRYWIRVGLNIGKNWVWLSIGKGWVEYRGWVGLNIGVRLSIGEGWVEYRGWVEYW